MEDKPNLTGTRPAAWTRPDDYLGALARRRTARKAREPSRRRTQPESPRFSLSTLPFLVLMSALLVITIGVIATAWPGSAPPPRQQAQQAEQGTAPKGWYQEAEREFHR
ncbi:MAG TPA: hypothetical protein VF027_02860 [Sphingomicrobium sp.]